jgi:hypothetical protein
VVVAALQGRSRPREWLLPLRHPEDRVRPVTHVRSSTIVTAQGLLREGGKWAAYAESVAPEVRPAVFGIVPGTWLPVDTALAHHRAVDTLRLAPSEQIALATGAGEKMQGAMTGTLLRMSREVGITPWTLMPHSQRIWDRVCRGGDISVERVGPKEVVIRMYGLPMFECSFFRVAIRYTLQNGLALWCTRGYVTEVAWSPTSATFREAWA